MKTTCAYCNREDVTDTVTRPSDHDGWAALAKEHKPDCEWIATRAHSRDASSAGRALRAIPSEKRSAASAANGRKGGGKGGRPVVMTPQARAFADACHTNAIDELETALQGAADKTDCKTWKITPAQWRLAIRTALAEMRAG